MTGVPFLFVGEGETTDSERATKLGLVEIVATRPVRVEDLRRRLPHQPAVRRLVVVLVEPRQDAGIELVERRYVLTEGETLLAKRPATPRAHWPSAKLTDLSLRGRHVFAMKFSLTIPA